tara:strand:- start:437 stop:595 length:159 start_codon:yes stop_codon:yes gene_type:complete
MKKIRILVLAISILAGPMILSSCSSGSKSGYKVNSKSGMGNPKDRNNGVWGR